MSSQFCIRVGNNIKKYRKEKNITLRQLADKVELTEATVQKYEAGNIKKIDAEMLKKLADALDVPPENITEWNAEEYNDYREEKRGKDEGNIIKMYSRLTHGHKKAVRTLITNLLECQEKYKADK